MTFSPDDVRADCRRALLQRQIGIATGDTEAIDILVGIVGLPSDASGMLQGAHDRAVAGTVEARAISRALHGNIA